MPKMPIFHHEISEPDSNGIVQHRVSIKGRYPLKDFPGSQLAKDIDSLLEFARYQEGKIGHDR